MRIKAVYYSDGWYTIVTTKKTGRVLGGETYEALVLSKGGNDGEWDEVMPSTRLGKRVAITALPKNIKNTIDLIKEMKECQL